MACGALVSRPRSIPALIPFIANIYLCDRRYPFPTPLICNAALYELMPEPPELRRRSQKRASAAFWPLVVRQNVKRHPRSEASMDLYPSCVAWQAKTRALFRRHRLGDCQLAAD